MDTFITSYEVNAATWFWLSLLLSAAVFIRFSRIWSIRNLGLVLLFSLTPGLLLIDRGYGPAGYSWLFTVSILLLLRLFFDQRFRRRPRFAANLNGPGLTFLCVAVSVFLLNKIAVEPLPASTVDAVREAEQLVSASDPPTKAASENQAADDLEAGPTASVVATASLGLSRAGGRGLGEEITARVFAGLAHLSVVAALILIGGHLYGDWHAGVAMATLYLVIPCTAFDSQRVIHVLPSAFILWAIYFYRKPRLAGLFMGLACGALFFPLFLLPLWLVFYGKAKSLRFSQSFFVTAVSLAALLLWQGSATNEVVQRLFGSINWRMLEFRSPTGAGFWDDHDFAYRLPVFALFVVQVIVQLFLPRRKTLEHLLAQSAATILAIQFWYPEQGGVYILWYLPLVILIAFRPRLVHHTAEPEVSSRRIVRTGPQTEPVPPREEAAAPVPVLQ